LIGGGPVAIARAAAREFVDDDALTLAAAVAFYTALSLAPIVVLLLDASTFLGEGIQARLIAQIASVVGPQASAAIEMIVESAEDRPAQGRLARIVGLTALVFSASGVFAQLQASMNRIWDVRTKPGGAGWWNWIRKRLLSIGMLVTVGFLLLVSLAVSTAIDVVLSGSTTGAQAVNFAVSSIAFVLLFATMLKVFPDVRMPWRTVWTGAVLTAILFVAGKTAIGLYLGNGSVGSAYGAAGSLLVLLSWVYYSTLILFLGAEITQVHARLRGVSLRLGPHAEWEESAPEARPGGGGPPRSEP
jgi:membrane protein